MLTIRNLVKTFEGARSEKHKRVQAVDDISFDVQDGGWSSSRTRSGRT